MVLGHHMLHLNAIRQLWSLSVPGCGPAPRRRLPLVGKCFQRGAGRSHFSWSNFQMQDTEDEKRASVCRSVCFSMCVSLLRHICSQAQSMLRSQMRGVKRWGLLQVDITIGLLLRAVQILRYAYFKGPYQSVIDFSSLEITSIFYKCQNSNMCRPILFF